MGNPKPARALALALAPAALVATVALAGTALVGNENGGTAQTSNGRPNTLPYAFTLRVVATTAPGDPGPVMTGEDRRQLFLHRDEHGRTR